MLFLCGFWAWSQFVQLWWQSMPQVPPLQSQGPLGCWPMFSFVSLSPGSSSYKAKHP